MLPRVPFHTTRWSLIARAAQPGPQAARALDELCRVYWPPVYALYRRAGLDPEAAADLTQSLFADLLERGHLTAGDPARGRFRGYLATCARHALANARERANATKRGGGQVALSLDFAGEEQRWQREPVDARDADAVFERRWAQAVIETALAKLADEERAAGRGALFDRVRATLEGAPPPDGWTALAAELGTTEGALKVAAHRLRGRFRDALLAEVRDTMADPEAEGDELAHLFAALRA
jgi:RNA polymerase sigma factor (sigma-70 family)